MTAHGTKYPATFSGFSAVTNVLRPNSGEGNQTRSEELVTLKREGLTASFTRGGQTPPQLVSLNLRGTEFMWGGGKPEHLKTEEERKGWPNSIITMFPNVGSPLPSGKIIVEGVEYPMVQHGVFRYLPTEITHISPDQSSLVFTQEYKYVPGAAVETPKGQAVFPFSYTISEHFSLTSDSLHINVLVHNKSSKPMPYALGLHPAFRIVGRSFVVVSPRTYKLKDIKEASKTGAVILENTTTVLYVSEHGKLGIESNFGHTQVWSPADQNQVCIEPITAMSFSRYQYTGEMAKAPGYRLLKPGGQESFYAFLTPMLKHKSTL